MQGDKENACIAGKQTWSLWLPTQFTIGFRRGSTCSLAIRAPCWVDHTTVTDADVRAVILTESVDIVRFSISTPRMRVLDFGKQRTICTSYADNSSVWIRCSVLIEDLLYFGCPGETSSSAFGTFSNQCGIVGSQAQEQQRKQQSARIRCQWSEQAHACNGNQQ